MGTVFVRVWEHGLKSRSSAALQRGGLGAWESKSLGRTPEAHCRGSQGTVPPSSAPWSASEVCNEGFASLLSPFLHSFLPFFLFFFFFNFFLPLFFPPSPPERANFYQANSIKRIKNCFWISEPDQIPDSLLNSCMNLGKWFTPAPPFFFFFFPVRGRTVVQLLTWEVVSIHLKNVCKLLHTVPDTKEVIQKHSFPALFNLGMTSFAP